MRQVAFDDSGREGAVSDDHTYTTYSNNLPELTLDDIRQATKNSLVDYAARSMQRDLEYHNDRKVAAMLPAAAPDPHGDLRFPIHGWKPPSIREIFETMARRTPEFRKFRAELDGVFSVGAQVVEAQHVPEKDSEGKKCCWTDAGDGVVWLASPKIVTEMRFDAWMQRLDEQHCPDRQATDWRRP